MNLRRFAIPGTIALVVLIIGAFGAWYFYLHGKETLISATSSGRGLGVAITSSFPSGSAYGNIAKTINSILGGSNATTTGEKTKTPAPRLWQAGVAPTAGITWIESATSTALRFVDQASGNVFDAHPQDSSITRRTNTLVPKIVEARFVGNSGIIARFIGNDGIESFSANIVAASSTRSLTATASESLASANPGSLAGIMLPRNITSIAFNQPQKNTSVFYLAPYQGGAAGTLSNANGTNATRIWQSSLTGWNSEWVGDHILLSQRSAGGVIGSAYTLSQKGNVRPLISNEPGLFVRENRTTGSILYSTVQANSTVALTVRNTDGSSIDLPFTTLADKCLWSTRDTITLYCAVPRIIPANTTLPDAWYRGEIHFSDSWWRFNTKTGSVDEVYNTTTSNQSLDILDPVMSEDGAYIGFIDATTGTAWVLRINQ